MKTPQFILKTAYFAEYLSMMLAVRFRKSLAQFYYLITSFKGILLSALGALNSGIKSVWLAIVSGVRLVALKYPVRIKGFITRNSIRIYNSAKYLISHSRAVLTKFFLKSFWVIYRVFAALKVAAIKLYWKTNKIVRDVGNSLFYSLEYLYMRLFIYFRLSVLRILYYLAYFKGHLVSAFFAVIAWLKLKTINTYWIGKKSAIVLSVEVRRVTMKYLNYLYYFFEFVFMRAFIRSRYAFLRAAYFVTYAKGRIVANYFSSVSWLKLKVINGFWNSRKMFSESWVEIKRITVKSANSAYYFAEFLFLTLLLIARKSILTLSWKLLRAKGHMVSAVAIVLGVFPKLWSALVAGYWAAWNHAGPLRKFYYFSKYIIKKYVFQQKKIEDRA